MIQPTVTQRVRAFLSSQGADVQAWSGLDETYTQLYALLSRRRDDPSFWEPLRELLGSIIDSTTDPTRPDRLPAGSAELLTSWNIDELVAELRAALPSDDQTADTGKVRSFASTLSAVVMGGFLLLGLAACSDDSSKSKLDVAIKVDGKQVGDQSHAGESGSWSASCSLQSSSVLWGSIDKSQLSSETKHSLCTCFAALSTSWNDGLTALFQTGTAAQISSVLQEMVQCCTSNKSVLDSSYADVKDKLLSGTLCSVPVYKGVSFPG